MNLDDLKIKINVANSGTGEGTSLFNLLAAIMPPGSHVFYRELSSASEEYDRYYENVDKLIALIHILSDYRISSDCMVNALTEHRIDPMSAYADISAGTETERIIELTEALGLPQHALIGRGIDIKGKVVEADKESIRWLPEGASGA